MKHAIFFWISLVAVAAAPAVAQYAPPAAPAGPATAPSPAADLQNYPNPRTYSDPGMEYTAPAEAYLVGRREVPLSALNNDLQTVAVWVINPNKENTSTIQLAMESYEGPPDQWEGQFESQTHGSQDGTLIRNKTPMSLLNGMPAYFVEVAYGSGFDAKKEFAIVWADGQRGIVLAVTSRLGDVSADQAKEALKQATAVRYPVNQP